MHGRPSSFSWTHILTSVRLVQDVAQKTNEVAGDGTTTATVLAHAIYAEGVKNVAAGCNPMDLRRGSQAAVERVVEFLSKNTRTITTTAEIAQVATISANGDTHVGNLIAQAMEKVGKEGVITVKEGRTIEDEIEITEGMRFDRGFISPYFVTDVKAQKVEFEKPYVLLSEKKISAVQDIIPALETSTQLRRPLVIIAEDIDGEALAVCILNKLRGQLQVAAVKAPGFGDNRKSILGDIAVLTNATVFTDELDIKLEKATPDMFGSTGSITITKEDTIILNGEGSKDSIAQRCEQIRGVMADPSTSEYEKEKLQERLAKLSGGVAVIKVGGASEVEVGEKKDRVVDVGHELADGDLLVVLVDRRERVEHLAEHAPAASAVRVADIHRQHAAQAKAHVKNSRDRIARGCCHASTNDIVIPHVSRERQATACDRDCRC